LKEIVGPAERAVLCCLSDSCSLSGTGTGDGALLEIGVVSGVVGFLMTTLLHILATVWLFVTHVNI